VLTTHASSHDDVWGSAGIISALDGGEWSVSDPRSSILHDMPTVPIGDEVV
jgi:hypothetical protein